VEGFGRVHPSARDHLTPATRHRRTLVNFARVGTLRSHAVCAETRVLASRPSCRANLPSADASARRGGLAVCTPAPRLGAARLHAHADAEPCIVPTATDLVPRMRAAESRALWCVCEKMGNPTVA
jgi:hypothetical protein